MNALILRLSALGDVIHTVPAVMALRGSLPETRFSWVVEAPYRELVEIVTGVDAIPVRMKKWGRSLSASRNEIGAALRAMHGVDASIDFQGLVKSAAIGWLSRARTRYGFDANAIREKAALPFINERIAVDPSRHVIEQNLALAQGVIRSRGAQSERTAPEARWGLFAAASGLDELADAIVLLPGAGKANKLWPVERFRELARRVGPRALAVWGPGEREMADAIGARVAPPTTLRELAWILRRARVVVGADTGPLHLAAAMGTPVAGLYGPTDPRRNGPYGQLDHCVDRFRSTKLMESISVEDAMTMIERASRA